MFVLSVLLLVVVLSLRLRILYSLLVIVLMHRRYFECKHPFCPSCLVIYNRSMSSLEYKALSIVIHFLVLWSICRNLSVVHYKNGVKYLTKGAAQAFIHLMRFLLCSLVSSNFFVLLIYSFFFFNLRLFNGVRFQYPKVFVGFNLSEHSYMVLI